MLIKIHGSKSRHTGEGRYPAIQNAFDLNPLDTGLRRYDGLMKYFG
jgi:hypothetical protein